MTDIRILKPRKIDQSSLFPEPCNRLLLLLVTHLFRLTGPNLIVLSASSPLYNPIPRPRSAQPYSSKPDVLSFNRDEEESSIGMPSQMQSMQLVQQQDRYLSQRGQAIESIESTIHELGSIFQQLAQMVSEQAETVQRIDANTDDIVTNVGGAQRELLKYYARVTSNRWLMIKIFGVLIIFFLLWVLVS